MRHLNLAAAVLLGVGMFTIKTGAQTAPQPQTPEEFLSLRARAALERLMKTQSPSDSVPRLEFQGDVDHLRLPVDCGMPVIKGDPAIDPLFSKQPQAQMAPGSTVRHTMTVVPVEPCRR